MNITFIIKSISNPGGGAERVLSEIASALVERGHRVSIITFDAPNSEPFYRYNSEIQILRLNCPDRNRLLKIMTGIRRILLVRKSISSVSPEVLVSFMISSFVIGCFASIQKGIPHIASEHTVFDHYANKPLQRLLIHLIKFICKTCTVVSTQAKETYPIHVQSHLAVIPNPRPTIRSVTADTSGSGKIKKTVLSVGRLDNAKNHRLLLQAFALISSEIKDWQLRIVGDGPCMQELKKLSHDLNISHMVLFAGFKKNIDQEYLNAQLFAVPSLYESDGLVTVEALSYGLPVVGIKSCPGTNNHVKNDFNGMLVEVNSNPEKEFSRCLLKIIRNDSYRKQLSENILQQSKELVSANPIDTWEQLLLSQAATKLS